MRGPAAVHGGVGGGMVMRCGVACVFGGMDFVCVYVQQGVCDGKETNKVRWVEGRINGVLHFLSFAFLSRTIVTTPTHPCTHARL